ncbi:MAG: PHB depolymerase family esterase [Candidatus Sericytochromatia bacterium]|nr:PHB depolymerase family esterase [Candidatus Tanganyikabacteria bacterium]
MRLARLGAVFLLVVAGCGAAPAMPAMQAGSDRVAAQASGSFTQSQYQGFTYKLYLPPNFKRFEPLPLVVMLHGCGQNADEMNAVTRMNDVAESGTFAVLYPEQSKKDHPRQCWRWFDPPHQARGAGEPAIIAGMVGQVTSLYGIDRSRMYVAGLSAGGAMSTVMAATYPDLFAAGSSASGLEYLASTTTEADAWGAMARGGPDPAPIAARVVAAMGDKKVLVPMAVFHGAVDPLVNRVNGDQTATQFAILNDLVLKSSGLGGLPATPETRQAQVPGGRAYLQSVYRDTQGRALVEEYMVDGMSHAWSGGAPGRLFSDPKGPDASRLVWEFFKRARRN